MAGVLAVGVIPSTTLCAELQINLWYLDTVCYGLAHWVNDPTSFRTKGVPFT